MVGRPVPARPWAGLPYCIKHGAAHTFANQKGADAKQIDALDRTVERIADVATQTSHKDFRNAKGAGAADKHSLSKDVSPVVKHDLDRVIFFVRKGEIVRG